MDAAKLALIGDIFPYLPMDIKVPFKEAIVRSFFSILLRNVKPSQCLVENASPQQDQNPLRGILFRLDPQNRVGRHVDASGIL